MLKNSRFFFMFIVIFILFVGCISVYGFMGSLFRAELNVGELVQAVNIYKVKRYNLNRRANIEDEIDSMMLAKIDVKIKEEIALFERMLKKDEPIKVDSLDSDGVSYKAISALTFNQYILDQYGYKDAVSNTGSFNYLYEGVYRRIYYDYISDSKTYLIAEVDVNKFRNELLSAIDEVETSSDYPFYILNGQLEIIYVESKRENKYVDKVKEKLLSIDKKTIEKVGFVHYTIDSAIVVVGHDANADEYYCVEVEKQEYRASIFTHTIAILSIAAVVLLGIVLYLVQRRLK